MNNNMDNFILELRELIKKYGVDFNQSEDWWYDEDTGNEDMAYRFSVFDNEQSLDMDEFISKLYKDWDKP